MIFKHSPTSVLKRFNQVGGKSYKWYSQVHFPEQSALKPKLNEFKYPLFNTFLIASTTYFLLNSLWMKLECDDAKDVLSVKADELETTIQSLVDDKKAEMEKSQRKRYSIWSLWR